MPFKKFVHIIVATLLMLLPVGCKKDHKLDTSTGPSAEEIKDRVDDLAQGMKHISVDKVTKKMRGKDCVIAATTDEDATGSTPPPPGMLQVLGVTTIFTATLADVTSESLTVKANYPSGKTKQIEISLEDIQEFAIEK